MPDKSQFQKNTEAFAKGVNESSSDRYRRQFNNLKRAFGFGDSEKKEKKGNSAMNRRLTLGKRF